MNVYDAAHQLARAIKQSSEYTGYAAAKAKVDGQEGTAKMLSDLRAKQWELQELRMKGQEPTAEQMAALQKMAELVSHSPTLQEFLNAEYRFGQMVEDVQKIMGDAIRDLLPQAEEA
ncbi:YlbF family regulator [Heliophilum fasciatum]|uniref:UPF0342 protein EDD73_12819 n=1 Tax=Heliophilum fasciatum TaxID=35700 RepID=A0A4R2RNU5_9FIRM|nr:YlbF family regulator [Heliophilum fasciatum]MCW2279084.1 cell fate (sporulation/competence/biofilm development) regulator YlbF (YheA/YmcA/DUF963 family) [Heliophilum fasciatum]TCP61481.1 cell fate (sporulation/competence/biofilm development) regulator YlbF (YheA/YmcA/DUF963 family) [Heliophilum fasciatum]